MTVRRGSTVSAYEIITEVISLPSVLYGFYHRGSIQNESLRQSFDEKGVIEVPVTGDMEPVNMDKYLEIAIEVGAEDVILIEDPTVDNDSMKKVLKVTN